MRLFRNPVVKLVLYAGVPLAVLSWLLLLFGYLNDWDALYILIVAGIVFLLLLALFFFALHLHFNKVIRFSEKVKKNTGGEIDLQFNDFEEGDFPVLQDEIRKMVRAHFNQQEELQAEKNRLSDALADISHQIITPLINISTTAQRMIEQPMEPMEQALFAQRIRERTVQIEVLVKTLLKMSRMDAGVMTFHRETMTAQELVSKSCGALELAMELNEVRLVKEVPDDLILESDPVLLPEALSNILKNCMEHTPSGGTVSIRVSENAVYTEIVIRDTGIGIAEEDLPHVFERFYKGRYSHSGGFGIGLSFAKMVVEALKGTIDPDNHPDGGAVFKIELQKDNGNI